MRPFIDDVSYTTATELDAPSRMAAESPRSLSTLRRSRTPQDRPGAAERRGAWRGELAWIEALAEEELEP